MSNQQQTSHIQGNSVNLPITVLSKAPISLRNPFITWKSKTGVQTLRENVRARIHILHELVKLHKNVSTRCVRTIQPISKLGYGFQPASQHKALTVEPKAEYQTITFPISSRI